MIFTIQDIHNFEDKSNFSPKLKKIIKEEEIIQNIVKKIIEESMASEKLGIMEKD